MFAFLIFSIFPIRYSELDLIFNKVYTMLPINHFSVTYGEIMHVGSWKWNCSVVNYKHLHLK